MYVIAKKLIILSLLSISVACSSRTIIIPVNRDNTADDSVMVYANGMKPLGKGKTSFEEIIPDSDDPSYIELRKDGCDTKRFDLKRRTPISRVLGVILSAGVGTLIFATNPDFKGAVISSLFLIPTLYTQDYKANHVINYTCVKTLDSATDMQSDSQK